jgi:hypothetical protein
MVDGIPERRALELTIRRSEAEERLLERRLRRLEDEQARTSRAIKVTLSRQPWTGLLG